MDAPIHNPIRFSPNKCPDCVEIERLEEQKRLEEQEILIEKERPQAESESES
jgi:glutaredoxin